MQGIGQGVYPQVRNPCMWQYDEVPSSATVMHFYFHRLPRTRVARVPKPWHYDHVRSKAVSVRPRHPQSSCI